MMRKREEREQTTALEGHGDDCKLCAVYSPAFLSVFSVEVRVLCCTSSCCSSSCCRRAMLQPERSAHTAAAAKEAREKERGREREETGNSESRG